MGELVHRRLDTADRWNLALVQRAEVWDHVRMRQLLDSLLAGYPIGAILLCRSRDRSRVLEVVGDNRVEREAADSEWQLLDGQQRINAVFSMLTRHGDYGRFYLDVTVRRPEPQPAQARASKERTLPHLLHAQAGADEVPHRERTIDLSGWCDWADARDNLGEAVVDASSVSALLREIDPAFAHVLSDDEAEIATGHLRALVDMWVHPSVPILAAVVDGPLDILEVFTRINLGGVNVAGADVFFAGVKTFWHDAERRVDALLGVAPFTATRLGALRLAARLASRGLGHGDITTLAVERLAGDRGASLREAMEDITAPDGVVVDRLRRFTDWYPRASDLGFVLREVSRDSWDEVYAWAAAGGAARDDLLEASREALDSYLLAVTVFGYRNALGDRFRRIAFLEALAAGGRGEPFPAARVLSVVRSETRLRGARGRAVPRLDLRGGQPIADKNGRILTALAQRIPLEMEPEDAFDWDHIFPQAQASRMWAPGEWNRRRHHPDRYLVNSAGNFWALSASANRSIKDAVGSTKFTWLAAQIADESNPFRVWPEARWSITREEIDRFVRVDALLTDDPTSIDSAMALFREVVEGRTRRLLKEMLERFPMVRAFAGEHADEGGDPASPADLGFREALGISARDPRLLLATENDARKLVAVRGDRLAAGIATVLADRLGLADQWSWPRRWRADVGSWRGFQLSDGNCIELILRWDHHQGMRVGHKGYATRGKAGDLYPDFPDAPLGVEWGDSDERIVEAFVERAEELVRVHPQG